MVKIPHQHNQQVSRYPRMETVESEREVVVVTTVTITTRTPTSRYFYKGMSDEEILTYEGEQETEVLLEEFAKDVESTPADKLIIARTVKIVDKQ